MNNTVKLICVLLIAGIAFFGCKDEFLDIKPDKKLVVPTSITDAQALLDNDVMYNNSPYIGEIASGDFVVEYNRWLAFQTIDRNAYIWAPEVYEGNVLNDWNYMYRKVYISNIAMQALEKLTPAPNEKANYDNALGNALFNRAWSFYVLAQVFCKPYVTQTAASDLGIPLRIDPDINIKSVRSTVGKTYQQIIEDAQKALKLLPNIGIVKTRASKASCYGLLAKTFQLMENYSQSALYADSAITIMPELIDYNGLNASLSFPLTQFNKEVVFHQAMPNIPIFNPARLIMEPMLYNQYDINDLRKTIFFFLNAGNLTYKGSYNGNTALFSGIAVDELYLIRSEDKARTNKLEEAKDDINLLLFNRYKKGTYINFDETEKESILKFILAERRKELIFRGIRWSDLRRLNHDSATAVTITRVLNSQSFQLIPNSNRYVFPFPDEVIKLSGMEQNPR